MCKTTVIEECPIPGCDKKRSKVMIFCKLHSAQLTPHLKIHLMDLYWCARDSDLYKKVVQQCINYILKKRAEFEARQAAGNYLKIKEALYANK